MNGGASSHQECTADRAFLRRTNKERVAGWFWHRGSADDNAREDAGAAIDAVREAPQTLPLCRFHKGF